jgi:murein DD-endopeptidase MepM/ murein hydrolase activator NlpD
MKRIVPILVVLSLLLAASSVRADEVTQRFQAVADRMVNAINAADYPRIQQDFDDVMLKAFPLEKSRPFFRNMTLLYGKIEKLDPPRYTPPNQAVFPAHFKSVVLDIKIVLDDRDKIVGLWFLPHTPDIPAPEKHETALRLPFDGTWFVVWGGDTKEMNQHHDVPNQSHAFDFVMADGAGRTYKNKGLVNEDYFAFGQEILAPAAGTVKVVIRGVPDNAPSSMNPYSALGNAVIISHRENEVSVLAHLKEGSIRVEPGEQVAKGQVIGLCGNSGNSSEPHLHYHLQNTPVIQDGTGIKCMFEKVKVTRDGKTESRENYSPVKDDRVTQE